MCAERVRNKREGAAKEELEQKDRSIDFKTGRGRNCRVVSRAILRMRIGGNIRKRREFRDWGAGYATIRGGTSTSAL